LGGVISNDATCDKDVFKRIGLAAGIVRNLNKVWIAQDLSREVKVKIYQSLVPAVFVYDCETCGLREDHKRQMTVFDMAVLRTGRIFYITRRDRRWNIDVMNELDIKKDIVAVVQQRRLGHFGHIC